MRKNKMTTALGAAILAVALLAGCGGNGGTAENGDAGKGAASEKAAVPKECSDPLAKAQAAGKDTLNAREVAFCMSEALGKLAGWQQENLDANGKPSATAKVNVRPLAAEITAKDAKTGKDLQVVLVEGTTFINRDGKWEEANALAHDSDMVAFAALPRSFEALLNSQLRAAGVDPTLEYKVTGKEEIAGTPVYVLELPLSGEKENNPSAPSSEKAAPEKADPNKAAPARRSRLFMRADYVVVRTENYVDDTLVNSVVLTEIDKAQHIINPRYGKDIYESEK